MMQKFKSGVNMIQETILNGIPTGELAYSMETVQDKPQSGKFTFRAKTKWQNGANCRTEIKDFDVADEPDTSRTNTHTIEADEPPCLLGTDHGANATEALLHALGSCLNAAFIYHATAQGIKIEELQVDLQGDLDVAGFLGVNENVRNGYEHIDVNFKVKSNAPSEQIEKLCKTAQQRSPVFDIVTHPVDVSVNLEKIS